MHGVLRTAGERVELICRDRWLSGVLEEGAAGQLTPPDGSSPDVRVTVEDSSAPFDTTEWDVLTRDAWSRTGQVIIRNACSSGLDLRVTASEETCEVLARWRPPASTRAATMLLRSRARLLVRAVLLQYPAIWWSQRRGCMPLHASVCTIGSAGPTVLIAGPGGIGKSTLVNAELANGAMSTCDNLCVSDGCTTWGVTEPRRVPSDVGNQGRGRRMPHGRREIAWPSRVEVQTPDYVVVLRRGAARLPTLSPIAPDEAARFLEAGTFMAGELRRYWAFAATLALGSGIGEASPAVDETARVLSSGRPCLQLTLGERSGRPLGDLLGSSTAMEVGR